MGMMPHERAEVYEERGMFKEALRWHREDLKVARRRAQDGEEENERNVTLDFARALRNTGRCLGRLGMRGFAEVRRGSAFQPSVSVCDCVFLLDYFCWLWGCHQICHLRNKIVLFTVRSAGVTRRSPGRDSSCLSFENAILDPCWGCVSGYGVMKRVLQSSA